MNNGHTSQNSDNVLKFPPADDSNDSNLNNANPETNLNATSPDAWGVTPSRDPRSFGEKAINGHNQLPHDPESAPDLSLQTPELGQIIDLNMPPGATQDSTESSVDIAKEAIDLSHLVAKNDSISPEATKTVEKTVDSYENGKISPAELVNSVYEFRDAYRKNSFGDGMGAAA